MNDDKLALEESRRAAQHEAVKSQVESEVQADITTMLQMGEPATETITTGELTKRSQSARHTSP